MCSAFQEAFTHRRSSHGRSREHKDISSKAEQLQGADPIAASYHLLVKYIRPSGEYVRLVRIISGLPDVSLWIEEEEA